MASLEAVMEALTRMDLAGLAGQRRELSDDEKLLRTRVYVEALAELSDADVLAAAVVITRSPNPYYPTPGQLIEAVRPRVSEDAAVTRGAVHAYDAIVESYAQGRGMGAADVYYAFGEIGVTAFLSAGGGPAFAYCEPGRDESFRLKRWTDAWREAAQAAAADGRALVAGADHRIETGAARRLIADVAARCPACGRTSSENGWWPERRCLDAWHKRAVHEMVNVGVVLGEMVQELKP